MPHFDDEMVVARPRPEVFDFFLDPANLVRVSPPELHMRLVEAPPRLQLGSVIVLRGRRWGIPQRVVSEIVALEPGVSFVDSQRTGPFGKWVHTHRFETVPEGTRLHDHIEYEPPGGLLGLVVTVTMIERDLKWVYEYRRQKLRELLGGSEVADRQGE
jgi:ligand-binding SRPBCC domain-containing protein